MTRRGRRVGVAAPATAMALAAVLSASCDTLFTEAPDDEDLLDAPFPGLSSEELNAFARGDAAFGQRFTIETGLGPIFNNVSCAGCHSGDGRGRPENILLRFSTPGRPPAETGAPQLQDRAVPGAVPEMLPQNALVSGRLPPPVFGVGLIEAIPAELILSLADPDDDDGDGISGRPHLTAPPGFVPTDETGGAQLLLGRFSRKAQVTTILQQVVEAYHQDIGITSEFLPVENFNPQGGGDPKSADGVEDPELATSTIRAVIAYLRMLTPPAPGRMTPRRERGREVFETILCGRCHVPELRTGPSPIAALSDQPVLLYSDLLLHDMGEGLADNRPDGDATGREWRTTPLWGLRVMRDFLNGDAFLLHDGRSRSVEDAILLHGGEAGRSASLFRGLSSEDRDALLDFVESR